MGAANHLIPAGIEPATFGLGSGREQAKAAESLLGTHRDLSRSTGGCHEGATTARPFRFALIACSASKLDRAAPARELYTGALFKASLAVAESLADRVIILSAKHGVLELDTIVEPYDLALAQLEKHRRAQWGATVASSLLRAFGIKDRTSIAECRAVGATVLCLAPGSYVDSIGHLYGVGDWTKPLKGLGIGHQKQRLAQLRNEIAAVSL